MSVPVSPQPLDAQLRQAHLLLLREQYEEARKLLIALRIQHPEIEMLLEKVLDGRAKTFRRPFRFNPAVLIQEFALVMAFPIMFGFFLWMMAVVIGFRRSRRGVSLDWVGRWLSGRAVALILFPFRIRWG
jgi:hypothetical protein